VHALGGPVRRIRPENLGSGSARHAGLVLLPGAASALACASGRPGAGNHSTHLLSLRCLLSPMRQAAAVLPQCTTATRLLQCQGTEAPQRHWQQSPWRGCCELGSTPSVCVWCVCGMAGVCRGVHRRARAGAQTRLRASMRTSEHVGMSFGALVRKSLGKRGMLSKIVHSSSPDMPAPR